MSLFKIRFRSPIQRVVIELSATEQVARSVEAAYSDALSRRHWRRLAGLPIREPHRSMSMQFHSMIFIVPFAGIRSPLPKYSCEEDNFLFGLQGKGDSRAMA